MSIKYVMPSVENNIPKWEFINDVSDGWDAIERNVTKYIKKEDKEEQSSYDARIDKLTYFDGFNPVIQGIKGLLFKKPITFTDNTISQIENISDNIDMQGNSLNNYIGTDFENAMRKGLSFTLIDLPNNAEVVSKADELSLGIRPYFINIEPKNITSYKTEKIRDTIVLTQVKIREFVEVDNDENPYATKTEVRYRVLEIGIWAIYDEEDNELDYGLTNLDFIPLYCLNLAPIGMFEAKIPFYDLAKLCIAHTNIFTDTRHSAHLASVPMLKLLGFQPDEIKGLSIGANKAVSSTNENAKLEWLDYDGGGVEVNDKLMLKIEKRMLEIGLSALSEDNSLNGTTATAVMIDTTQKQSKINAWVVALESHYQSMFKAIAKMYNLNEGGGIVVDADILSNPLTAQEITAYNNMVSNRNMPLTTLWQLLVIHKNLPEDFNEEEALDLIREADLLTSKVEN
jgi:DNA-binding ferritin-like protein (Dps family)